MRTRAVVFFLFLIGLALAGPLARPLAAQTDVIRGRVTDAEGQPIPGVRVTATSLPGNVTRTATTNPQGTFQIAFPGGQGDYILGYAHFAYAFRQFQVKRLADEAVLIADTRLSPMQMDSIVVVANRQERVGANSQSPDVSGTERSVATDVLPADQQGDIAALAASLPGVMLVPGLDGEPDGFSVLGLDAEANSVTLNGLQSGVGSLPRDASVSSSLSTSPFDVSRGGFSGGEFAIRTRAGSNFKNRGMSLVMTAPQMQWTDPAGRALANDYTNVSLGATASGPIKRNSTFYNFSMQLGRQSRDNQTLLSTNALGLQTAGVAVDSVSRLVDILAGHGVPTGAASARNDRVTDNGTVFGSIDFSPPSSSAGHSFNLTLNGNWRLQAPVTASQLAFGSASGDRTSWGWGAQTRHSGYLGLILSETSAGVNVTRESSDPYLDLPAGRVRVSSLLTDGGSGVQTLTFGGNQGLDSESSTTNATLQNSLSWFDDANRHRMKLSSEMQLRRTTQHQASNLLGSFIFNSLEDLEAGRPASFTRTLSARERAIDQWIGSLSLGDSYRRTTDLQLQYGVRLDVSHFTTKPTFNPLVETVFGTRNDEIPTSLLVSPRLGFSWTLGDAGEIAAFTGAARAPRAVLRGGIGLFASNAGSGQVGQAIENTGLPSGTQQISCVGPAVPIPDWDAYANPGAVPDRCADGSTGTVFSNPSPNVTLFGEDYAPSRTVRSNLSWNGSILDARFSLNLEGTYSLNLNQQRSLDLNFDPTQRFTLPDEGRPVFVEPSSIVPSTGSIASRAARRSTELARVTELRSDLRSRTGQLSVRLSPLQRAPTALGWSLSYTFSHIREQVSGFTSTAGDPLLIEWAPSGQGPHQISYSLRYNFFNTVQVSWNGSFRSGSAFTPFVAGDVNGDGYSNDRAFIPDPASTTDPALAAGMRDLLQNAPAATRACLERQLGRLAERNGCRGPWSSTASLNLSLDRAKFRMPQRGSVSFSLSNPLGALDLLANGSGNLRGWGQNPSPDASLLYVRGFDPTTQRYRYEVNERFGATRPQFSTLRSPVTLTASVRIDLGPTRERQNLSQQLTFGRSQPGARYPATLYRTSATSTALNPMSTILRTQDTLRLTTLQADSIASMNRRYMYQADSIWAPVASYLAGLPNEYDEGAAYERFLDARLAQVDLLARIVPVIRGLLTDEQRRRLPASVGSLLDPRYLALVRGGTGMYVSGVGGGGTEAAFAPAIVPRRRCHKDRAMKKTTWFLIACAACLAALPSIVLAQGAPPRTPPPNPGEENPPAQPLVGPPIQRIQTASAVSTEPLGNIAGVYELRDGRVLVNDGLRRRLLLMDTTLALVTPVLDSLSEVSNTYGPRAGALLPYRGDSILFVDPASFAMVVLDPQGIVSRIRSVWRVEHVPYFTAPSSLYGTPGLDAKGRMVHRIPAQAARPLVPPPSNVPYLPDPPDSAFVVAVDLDTRALDTLGVLRIPKVERNIRMMEGGGIALESVMNPLPSTDDWAALPDGTIAFVRGREYRVEYLNPDGTWGSSERLPFEWQRLNDEDKIRLVDSTRTVMLRSATTSYVTAMIRWVNFYGQEYPEGFTAPPGYVPTVGFARDWRLPAGVEFPERYVYQCGPGEEPVTPPAPAGPPAPGTPPALPSCVPPLTTISTTRPTLRQPTIVEPSQLPDYRPPFVTASVRADMDSNLWIRTAQVRPVPGGGPVYDIVSRAGQLVNRIQLPTGYTLVGFGKGKVVYLSMRDASGIHLARVRLR